mgnify:FL=1
MFLWEGVFTGLTRSAIPLLVWWRTRFWAQRGLIVKTDRPLLGSPLWERLA